MSICFSGDLSQTHNCSSPAFLTYTRQFILDTYASNTGIGAVLSQVLGDGSEQVISYGSSVLSKQERRYCVTRRELLAVVLFLQHFRLYLLGRPFLICTDHDSLTWLSNFKEPEGQLAHWLKCMHARVSLYHCSSPWAEAPEC